MADALKGRVLASAFELGLIDCLAAGEPVAVAALLDKLRCDEQGLRMLLRLLGANEVIEQRDGCVQLTAIFRDALRYRDYMQMKLAFAGFVLHDLGDHFTTLVADPSAFHRTARLLNLFSYERCLQDSAENRQAAARWMSITTGLTRYEAPVCLDHYDFSPHRRMLDIGGNSGEFALRTCMRHPEISARVMDLPVVCRVGAKHVMGKPEAGRIGFLEGNALVDPLPRGFDLITFKSMLHDWPEPEAEQLLSRAVEALAPGGSLLIFERGPLELDECALSFSALPFLIFFRSFRDSSWYEGRLNELGLAGVSTVRLQLDTPFHLITGKKR